MPARTGVETKVLTSSTPKTNGFYSRVALKGDRLAVGAFGEDKVFVYTTTDGGVTWVRCCNPPPRPLPWSWF